MELLVKKAVNGDKEALIELVMKEKDNYFKLAYVYMRNREDALDMLQEMIVILYREIINLKKLTSFYSWSKTILVNVCKKELQKNKREASMEFERKLIYDEDLINLEKKVVLNNLIDNLSDTQAEVIRLRFYLDYSYEEISKVMDVPIGTVKSRINTGIKNLRKLIGGDLCEGFR